MVNVSSSWDNIFKRGRQNKIASNIIMNMFIFKPQKWECNLWGLSKKQTFHDFENDETYAVVADT